MPSGPEVKRIQDVQPAPVVSNDPKSPEAILARNAKTIQLQAASDSTFDTVLERFSDSRMPQPYIQTISFPLVSIGVALFLLGLAQFVRKGIRR